MRGGRRGLLSLVGVVVLVAAAIIGYRAFGPGETIDPARTGYPAAAPVAQPKLYGALLAAPLVVDGRIRVYAAKRQVYADAPVDVKATLSPFWSYRRWPQQLVGVVAGPGPVVVTKWSDGELVGLAARTGRVRWRADSGTAAGDDAYQGRRTGASTVYAPPDLYLAGSVVISVSTGRADAFDLGTGRRLWSRAVPGKPDCRRTFTGTGVLVVLDRCAGVDTATVLAAGTGAAVHWPLGAAELASAAPIGCQVGDSGCAGLWDVRRGWLIGADGGLRAIATPAPVPVAGGPRPVALTGRAAANQTGPDAPVGADTLAGASVRLVGTVLLAESEDGAVRAYDARTGAPRWVWPVAAVPDPGTRIVAVDAGHLSLLTGGGDLIGVDLRTGRQTSRYGAHPDGLPWRAGWMYAADGFLFVERLQVGATSSAPDTGYYFPSPTVLFGGTGPEV